jgi:hypothetical protein
MFLVSTQDEKRKMTKNTFLNPEDIFSIFSFRYFETENMAEVTFSG